MKACELDVVAVAKDFLSAPEMDVGRRQKSDAAVLMAIVVPVEVWPAKRQSVDVTMKFPGKCRMVLERLERAF